MSQRKHYKKKVNLDICALALVWHGMKKKKVHDLIKVHVAKRKKKSSLQQFPLHPLFFSISCPDTKQNRKKGS